MKKLSKKTLNKSYLSWFYGNLTCFSQEHLRLFVRHAAGSGGAV